MFQYITAIEPNADNYSIKITYNDHIIIIAEFKELLEKGIMTELKKTDIFNSVKIGNKGRSIIWQEYDIDFCADSLRLKCEKQPKIANPISSIRNQAKQLQQQAAAELEHAKQ
ncbi:MAG: hypothetical protein RL637_1350 [Pseudomonadota bacterium]|jgi:transcriptional regulator